MNNQLFRYRYRARKQAACSSVGRLLTRAVAVPAHLIPINAPPAEDCTLETMRTQACANQYMDFKGLLKEDIALRVKR